MPFPASPVTRGFGQRKAAPARRPRAFLARPNVCIARCTTLPRRGAERSQNGRSPPEDHVRRHARHGRSRRPGLRPGDHHAAQLLDPRRFIRGRRKRLSSWLPTGSDDRGVVGRQHLVCPLGALDAPFFVCGQDRRPPCRSQETHGQASLRLLRAWDVISLTDKKSSSWLLHGQ